MIDTWKLDIRNSTRCIGARWNPIKHHHNLWCTAVYPFLRSALLLFLWWLWCGMRAVLEVLTHNAATVWPTVTGLHTRAPGFIHPVFSWDWQLSPILILAITVCCYVLDHFRLGHKWCPVACCSVLWFIPVVIYLLVLDVIPHARCPSFLNAAGIYHI